jgi:hypothetical protein
MLPKKIGGYRADGATGRQSKSMIIPAAAAIARVSDVLVR